MVNSELYFKILGKAANKIADLPLAELYGADNALEFSQYGLTEKESEKLFASVKLAKELLNAKREEKPCLANAGEAAKYLMPLLRYEKREQFWVLTLNARNHVTDAKAVAQGNLNNSLVHPRDVFKFACLRDAASIIVAHNHPSGEVSPSLDDQKLTKCLVAAGSFMGIPVLDHIIIGDGIYYSFQEDGALPKED